MSQIARIDLIMMANLICGTCKYSRGCVSRLLKSKPCKLKVELDTKRLKGGRLCQTE